MVTTRADATTFQVSDRSTVIVGARSTMGPIAFETRSIQGTIRASVVDDDVELEPKPDVSIDVDLSELRSGNDLYDAEIRRRIDVRRFPACHLELRAADRVGPGRYSIAGEMTFHDITRAVLGSVQVTVDDDRLIVVGEKTFDIREFDIPPPTILMLKIYPDVQVQLFLEAVATDQGGPA